MPAFLVDVVALEFPIVGNPIEKFALDAFTSIAHR